MFIGERQHCKVGTYFLDLCRPKWADNLWMTLYIQEEDKIDTEVSARVAETTHRLLGRSEGELVHQESKESSSEGPNPENPVVHPVAIHHRRPKGPGSCTNHNTQSDHYCV